MAYLNKCMLIGNIGKDPEVRTTNNGTKSVKFSLATSKRYRDNNGEQKEQTTWHNIVVWGKGADTFEKLGLKKGTTLYVEGELTTRTWQDSAGMNRYITEVNASNFQILTPKSASTHQQAPSYDYANPQQQNEGSGDPFEDDLPFDGGRA